MSLSARRAWIEMPDKTRQRGLSRVALRKESVDRNRARTMTITICTVVALRKESVDRNRPVVGFRTTLGVALRKESVDRNA